MLITIFRIFNESNKVTAKCIESFQLMLLLCFVSFVVVNLIQPFYLKKINVGNIEYNLL